MPVIIPDQSGRSATIERPAGGYPTTTFRDGIKLLWWVGLAFLLMSFGDVLLGWYPLNFGSPQWEFGTISATVSNFAIPTLGLYLMLVSATIREEPIKIRATGIVMAVIALWLVALAVIYLTNIPIALKAVRTNDVFSLNVKKNILKWLGMFAVYETLYIYGALKALRRRSVA